MAYVAETLYFTWGGSIGSATTSPEVWQCGVHFARAALNPIDWVPGVNLAPMWDLIKTGHQSASPALCLGAVLKWAKLAHIGLDGHYASEPILYQAPTPVGGSASAGGAAPQLAMAITLWSGFTLGKGNYGRFYLPWPVATVSNTDGKHTWASQYAATWHAAISGVEGVLQGDYPDVRLSIPSQSGTMRPVTKIRCGNVVDTQRRRRNRLTETYVSYNYPNAGTELEGLEAEPAPAQ